jgi:5-methylcytosine-specific restriction protein A
VFQSERIYQRSTLHEVWGGLKRAQPQGGILTPAHIPAVLVITGQGGAAYGYHDRWDEDGVLHYSGAGQEGDMEFKRGNLALRDHAREGEAVYVFQQQSDGLRYLHEVAVGGWYYEDDVPDLHGNLRRAIVFKLVPLDQLEAASRDEVEAAADGTWEVPLAELRDRALGGGNLDPDPPELGTRRVYRRSRSLRVYVLRRAAGNCEGCGGAAPFLTAHGHPYLEPHHAMRLSDGGPDVPANVIALCPTCHRRVHHAADGESFNSSLRLKLRALESSD